jgi:hypothetical protein
VIAGLHCGHILFCNTVRGQLGQLDLRHFPAARDADLTNPCTRFLVARQVTLWHYQRLLVNEHPPQVASQDVVTVRVIAIATGLLPTCIRPGCEVAWWPLGWEDLRPYILRGTPRTAIATADRL